MYVCVYVCMYVRTYVRMSTRSFENGVHVNCAVNLVLLDLTFQTGLT